MGKALCNIVKSRPAGGRVILKIAAAAQPESEANKARALKTGKAALKPGLPA